ncbi:MAG: hypothetical protein J6Z04_05500 [Clostridia bacterium]|nr:hypothetical protein [Clostridia bacterium]
MTEQQIKLFCKLCIENSNRPFSKEQKELLKQAVDKAMNPNDLLMIVLSTWNVK